MSFLFHVFNMASGGGPVAVVGAAVGAYLAWPRDCSPCTTILFGDSVAIGASSAGFLTVAVAAICALIGAFIGWMLRGAPLE